MMWNLPTQLLTPMKGRMPMNRKTRSLFARIAKDGDEEMTKDRGSKGQWWL
jgi:hypothetical protein